MSQDALVIGPYEQELAEVHCGEAGAADVALEATDASGHLWQAEDGCRISAAGETVSLWAELRPPVQRTTCVYRTREGDCWFGSRQGAMRLSGGRWRYFAGRRWLPDDKVVGIGPAPEGGVRVLTKTGHSRLYSRRITLADKAAIFESRIAARHNRYGFVTSCRLERPDDPSDFVHEASDNDGLWTALYVAAEAFRYAATGDPDARELARKSLRAMMMLEEKSTIPGFPARAIVRVGEERVRKSGGEWHPSADGEWEWKGDTSSDELDGHYLAFAVYHDLVATPEEKEEIAAVVRRITDHLCDNDYCLIDVDGQHTRWAVHGPRYLNHDPAWAPEKGLNSLEILSHLKVAWHITGLPAYRRCYEDLIRTHHYALNTVFQKITTPGQVNHSDDELAFVAYYPLLLYEEDPDLRAIYLLSLERSWQIERPEACPLWNFIYGAVTGRPCDAERAVQTLREIPMDLRNWRMLNSHRDDIALDLRAGRFGERQSVSVLPAGERGVMKWNGNPYRIDTGGDGHEEDDGTFFLLPYWLARHHRIIAEADSVAI